MALTLSSEILRLRMDEAGVVRVAGTRVTLDSIVGSFLDGAIVEDIASRYPSLSLADVYQVIGYYLHHREEVDAYLAERQTQAENLKAEIERRFDPTGIRERLIARRNSMESQS